MVTFGAAKRGPQGRLLVLVLVGIVQLLPLGDIISANKLLVHCQDFGDLNKQQAANSANILVVPQHTFQPLNRQQFSVSSSSSSSISSSSNLNHSPPSLTPAVSPSSAGGTQAKQSFFQRPLLSSRFAAPNSQQPMNTAASTSNSVFASPQQQPSVAPNAATAAASASANGAGQQQVSSSNIEQLMKNALARTVRIEAPGELRSQENAPSAQQATATRSEFAPQSRSGHPNQPTPSVASQSARLQQEPPIASAASAPAAAAADKVAAASEAAPETQPSASSDEGQAATAAAREGGAHETVYSDQRFANLFARRNALKKAGRLNPTEQVRAKPTLPSFIKSLPDPKQFAAAAATVNQDTRPPPNQAGANFASNRLQQQQNLGRLNSPAGQQQKKPIIASTSAVNANNKRANNLNGGRQSSTVAPRGPASNSSKAAAANNVTTVTGKPASANNPFSRSQVNSSDPANVIAMARKRLLANNALESGKLKQQQQLKPANQ